MAEAKVVYNGKPKAHSWARWMVGRTMRQNRNNLISVIGRTGSGKTWSALSICEIMFKMDGVPFTIDHVVFSLRELMELINTKTLKKGSKIVFDEPQVSISARDFQSEANKVFNYLLTTFRHRNLTLFFCTPFETLLDKNTRRLFHARFETKSIDKKNNLCVLKPRFIEHNEDKGKEYRKRILIQSKDGYGTHTQVRYDDWKVPKPSKELIEVYEKKKREFTDRLNKNIYERLKKYDESGKSMTSTKNMEVMGESFTEFQKKIDVLEKEGYTQKEMGKILGKSQQHISQNKIWMDNKRNKAKY